MNLYAFNLNNALRFEDPDGQQSFDMMLPGNANAIINAQFQEVVKETGQTAKAAATVTAFTAVIAVTTFLAGPEAGAAAATLLTVGQAENENDPALVGVMGGGVIATERAVASEAAASLGPATAADDAVQQGKRTFSKADRAAGLENAKDAQGVPRCAYCKKELDPKAGKPNSYEADHRMPYSKGGPSTPDNLAPACRTCNRSKGAKTPEAWSSPEEWNPWIL